MKYDIFLKMLFEKFPQLNQEMKNNEHLEDLPHCVCDMIFVPYIVKACIEEQSDLLEMISSFLEEMSICKDEKVRELLNVSILEPIVLENTNLNIFKKFVGENTMRELEYWMLKYGC